MRFSHHDDWRFQHLVRESLHNLGEGVSLQEACRAARGLFPADVLRWFKDHGRVISDAASSEAIQSDFPYDPELHALDGEWYFSDATSTDLANVVGPESACLLGTPTVAAKLSNPDNVLVDRSPFLSRRFPDLRARLHTNDVETLALHQSFQTVLLDPPWYFPDLTTWLSIACQLTAVGGRIVLPLFGECTRPSAYRERAVVLNHLDSLGAVTVHPGRVEYDVPLFERRALAAAGANVEGRWRLADLVVVDVRRSVKPRDSTPLRSSKPEWLTFLLGSQVVKLRRGSAQGGTTITRPVDGVSNNVYDNVSRRDRRNATIGIWTSHNLVAEVLDFDSAESVLRRLARSRGPLGRCVAEIRTTEGVRASHLLDVLEVDE